MDESDKRDEEDERNRLVRFLMRPGPRFGLALAIYRDPVVAREIRKDLEKQVGKGFVLRMLSLDHEDRDLVAPMAVTGRGADGLFVTGLDGLLIDGAGRPDPSPLILSLNVRRDELPDLIDARVVLWMSKAGYRSFRDHAWDLHEVILTTCEFDRSMLLPQPASTVLELPQWFRAVDPEQARAIKSRAEALARAAEATDDARTRADAAASTARAYLEGAWLDEGLEWLERAATTYEQQGDLARAANERCLKAEVLAAIRGDLELAEHEGIRARDLAVGSGDDRQQAVATSTLADIQRAKGELEQAVTTLRNGVLPIFGRLADIPQQATTLIKVADALRAKGELDQALRTLQAEVYPLYERLGDVRAQAAVLTKIAGIFEARGDLEQALGILQRQALPLYERAGADRDKAVLLGKIADILETRKEGDRALHIRTRGELPVLERLGPSRERDLVAYKLETSKPVVLLAFASMYEAQPLRNLPREERHIRQALEPLVASGKLDEPRVLWNATVGAVMDELRKERFHGRVRVFHFGGDRSALMLADQVATGHSPTALADYLGRQEGLELVVLNGGSTHTQIKALRQAGVPAVVATACAISDDVAADFATHFYAELTTKPLKAAFEHATAAVRMMRGEDPRAIVDERLVAQQDWNEPWPWVLSCDEEDEGWMLIADGEKATDAGAIDNRALVDELASVSHERDTALILLSRIGFPRLRMQWVSHSLVFWSRVVDELSAGVLPDGVQRLVDAVAEMYPGNAFFERHRTK